MSMYQQFKTDPAVEKEGIWLDYGDFRVRVARAGGANRKWQKTLERLSRPYRRAIATNTIAPETAENIMREAYAEAVITDWNVKVNGEWVKGIENPEGEDLLDVTKENVLTVLQNLGTLYEDIQAQAQSWALFKADIREEAAGN